MKNSPRFSRFAGSFALALLLPIVSADLLHADTKPAAPAKPAAPVAPAKPASAKADPTGTWTWTFSGPNGMTFEPKLTLKLEAGKLVGTMSGRNGTDRPVDKATFDKGEIALEVVRERDGNKFVTNYKGKLEGDLIKGSMVSVRGGEERTTPWEAKRVK